jgi:hypothetical protein
MFSLTLPSQGETRWSFCCPYLTIIQTLDWVMILVINVADLILRVV